MHWANDLCNTIHSELRRFLRLQALPVESINKIFIELTFGLKMNKCIKNIHIYRKSEIWKKKTKNKNKSKNENKNKTQKNNSQQIERSGGHQVLVINCG